MKNPHQQLKDWAKKSEKLYLESIVLKNKKEADKKTKSYQNDMNKIKFDTNRKHYPVHSGCFMYFPDALKYISHVSWVGNEQHNKGEPLHWAREKSTDDADARARHILGEEFDVDGLLEEGKAAWRSLAVLQKKLEELNFKI